MTDDDWEIVLEVFQAVRSRRGGKGRDDRRFLEALHYFTVHNITWRALPAEFGPWSTVWRRFWRLSQNGTFEAFFRVLASCSRTAGIIQMFDSTSIRAHTRRLAQKGAAKPGARRLRHQDPHQVRPRRPAARLSPHRQRGQR
ncbi:transposase [Rhodovarius sp.]|uniref:transposase n=1 Tax=Rhodovarius sp. TaxID=2972673 RepID=UPI00333FEE03